METPQLEESFIRDIDAIANIQFQHKYNVLNKTSSPLSWQESFVRTWNRESRNRTLDEINRLYIIAQSEAKRCQNVRSQMRDLQDKLKAASVGIDNLILTYSDDAEYIRNLELISSKYHILAYQIGNLYLNKPKYTYRV